MHHIPGTVTNINDLRRLARRRLPRMVFDYIDGGAGDEQTLVENNQIYQQVYFRPKSARRTPDVDTSTSVLGHDLSTPIILAPLGSTRLFWPRGEAAAATAASKADTVYTLSTLSGTRLEEVREAGKGHTWYQLYLIGGRDVALSAIERAREAGYSALVVTIDTPAAGNRERDVKNGIAQLLSGKPLEALPFIWQIVARPNWLISYFADGGLMSFPNIILPTGAMEYSDIGAQLGGSAVSWEDLDWIREAWSGPILVKGVHTALDALQAADHGASAVIVSNHGGRQLDGVAPSLKVLPEVVEAVGDRIEVLVDGGIRRGSDVAKAIALGARAVLIGRAYAYGLAAAGEAGVSLAINILNDELILALRLLGCSKLTELTRDYIDTPSAWTI